MELLFALLISCILYFMVGYQNTAEKFFTFWAILSATLLAS